MNIINSKDAVPNKDGTYTVRFNCGKNAVNNLQTKEKIYGFAWRVYGSPYKVRAGRWNPIDTLVEESKQNKQHSANLFKRYRSIFRKS
jgi:hypothetical protein